MKKVLVVLAIVAMFGSIALAETGSCTAGSMTVNFSSSNFVIGLGWSTGTNRTISWSGSCSNCDYGPAIYGWASSPLVEYYIGRGGGTNRGSYSTSKGSFTLYTNSCTGPNITGSGAFTQYNANGDGSSSQNMGEHFSGWNGLGYGLTTQNYQVVAVESWSGRSGSANVSVSGSSWYTRWVNGGSATFACVTATVNATADVNLNTTYQQLEGFGAAGAWYENWLTANDQREAIYDILFRDLGLDIYRIRNTYDYNSVYMSNTSTIVSEALERNPNIKIMISSWSPPTYLKSTGQLNSGTLAGGPSAYVYDAFADWWADSITAWSSTYGVNIDYVSIQNEPEYNGNDRCLFDPTENSTNAGYNKAFKAVWQEFNSRWDSNMPKMLAPETAALSNCGSYINVLDDNASDLSHIYGFAHHLYDITYSSPDSETSAMQTFKNTYGYKPLFQTKYFDTSGSVSFTTAMYTAQHIHNSLVYEGVVAYLYWDLFWASPTGLLSFNGSYPGTSYSVNPPYYALKHYAYFTDPGWYRAGATTTSSDLRITAFRDATDTNTAIVILNKSTTNDVNLTLSLTGFVSSPTWTINEMYQSTSTSSWASLGQFNPSQAILLPAQSITTIHLATYQTCAEVQSNSHWLTSDINGDCYIDYLDLMIIADNWLRSDCSDLNNWCDWADLPWGASDGKVDFLDFSTFAPQWMRCNNPQDPNCRSSW